MLGHPELLTHLIPILFMTTLTIDLYRVRGNGQRWGPWIDSVNLCAFVNCVRVLIGVCKGDCVFVCVTSNTGQPITSLLSLVYAIFTYHCKTIGSMFQNSLVVNGNIMKSARM